MNTNIDFHFRVWNTVTTQSCVIAKTTNKEPSQIFPPNSKAKNPTPKSNNLYLTPHILNPLPTLYEILLPLSSPEYWARVRPKLQHTWPVKSSGFGPHISSLLSCAVESTRIKFPNVQSPTTVPRRTRKRKFPPSPGPSLFLLSNYPCSIITIYHVFETY